LSDLTLERNYINVYKKPLSARSRRRAISSLKNFLKYMKTKSDSYDRPFGQIILLKSPKIPKSLPKSIHEDQVDILLTELEGVTKKIGFKKEKIRQYFFIIWLWTQN